MYTIHQVNDATVNLSVSGSANFQERRYLLKTVEVPADSTVVIEKPINLGAGDKLETQASADGDIDDNPGGDLLIGRGWHPTSNWFTGSIDDLRIYDRALSAAEVQALYQTGN